MIIIAFAVWIIKNIIPHFRSWILNRKNRVPYPFSWEIIALVILSFIAVGVSGFELSALGTWKAYFFEPIVLFILLLNVFHKRKDWQKILWALLISAITVSFLAIYQKITGHYIFNEFWANAETRRVVSWFGYPNAIGLYLAPLIMLFIGWFFYLPKRTNISKSIQKLLIILIAFTSALSIYFAKSEGALIGLVAALGVFGLLAHKKARTITLTLAIVAAITISLYPPGQSYVMEKFRLEDLSGQIRQQQWQETWQMLQDGRILSGTGLNNYQEAIDSYHQEGIFYNSDNIEDFDSRLYGSAELRAKYWQPVEVYLYPHNIFLNFWSELGLLGALLFVWIIAKYFAIAYRLLRKYQKENSKNRYIMLGLIGAMTTIVVHGLVDVPYFKNDLSIIFWILLALLSFFKLRKELKHN